MRRQERTMKDKRETREQFSKRLDKVAFSLRPALISKAIGNMRTRCQRLFKAEGGLFEEGGASKRST